MLRVKVGVRMRVRVRVRVRDKEVLAQSLGQDDSHNIDVISYLKVDTL